jgi:hypothetical protein
VPARRRNRLIFFLGISVLVKALGSSLACAGTVSFSDGTFSPADWSLTTQTAQNGGAASAGQLTSGGNPGDCRQIAINVYPGNATAVFGFSLKNQAQYTPSTQGAITLFSYGEDRNTSGAGQEFGPALLQDGTYYYAYAGSGATTGWQSFPVTVFSSASFGTSVSDPVHPNFTATGDPITFGFVSINNTNQLAFSTTGDYDNWSVTLTTASVPEPASAMAFLLIGSLLCWRRRSAL